MIQYEDRKTPEWTIFDKVFREVAESYAATEAEERTDAEFLG